MVCLERLPRSASVKASIIINLILTNLTYSFIHNLVITRFYGRQLAVEANPMITILEFQ